MGARPGGGDDKLAALSGADGNPEDVGGWLGGYVGITRGLMARPLAVTALAGSLIVLIFTAFMYGGERKSELFLDIEPDQIYVLVQAQGSLSAAEEYAIVARAERAIEPLSRC